MVLRIRNILVVASLLVCSWMGWSGYNYFFDVQKPHLTISGITEGDYYCGDIECHISSNKSGTFCLFLDEKPLLTNFKFSVRNKEYPVTIPTKTIENGKHTLRAKLCDTSYHKNECLLEHSFIVDNVPLKAAFVDVDSQYKVLQGRTLHLQFQVNKEIKKARAFALSSKYQCFKEAKNSLVHECYIPIACEETPNEYLFSVEISDYVGNKIHLDNKFQIVGYPFKKQLLKLDKEKVKKEHELGKSPRDFEDRIEELTALSPNEKLWHGTFCTPIEIQRVTTDFGTIRTTQEKGRYMHKALDIINLPKSVVWATQDGIVVMKDRYAESGNTVIIDHGMGVLSMFFHLDEFANIEVGQKIKKGNPVGTLGKTGYADGYHCHWEQRVQNVPVDPMQWTKANF